MPETLKDFTRDVGAPIGLLSDNAKVEIQEKVQEWLRNYHIHNWTSEPHQQNQNLAEQRIGEITRTANLLMDRTGTPEKEWFMCTEYVVYVMNRLSHDVLNDKTPMEISTGVTPDISACLQFRWYEPVYYLDSNEKFPSSKEKSGRFVSIAEHCGDALTYLILTDDTDKVISRSVVRPQSATDPNLRTTLAEDGETSEIEDRNIVQLRDLSSDGPPPVIPKLVDPHDLIGAQVIFTDDHRDKYRAKVQEQVEDDKFVLTIDGGQREELMNYMDLCRLISKYDDEEDDSSGKVWMFCPSRAIRGLLLRLGMSW